MASRPTIDRRQRVGTAFTAVAVIACGVASGQTNLLTNGGFDTDAGFFGPGGACTGQAGEFCGWDGWNTDFADDGTFNNSWFPFTEGGFRFNNAYPATDQVNDPILAGAASSFWLGGFSGPTSETIAVQQVSINGGDEIRAGVFGYSDTTRLNNQGNIDTIYAQGPGNQFRVLLEFFNVFGDNLGATVEDVIFDPDTDPGFDGITMTNPLIEDKWVEGSVTATAPASAAFARIAIFFDQIGNQGGVVFADNASLVNLSTGTPAIGDFDFDGVLGPVDLHLLTLAVEGDLLAADDRFDLNGDSSLSMLDIDAWLAVGGAPGDYNGDGTVNAADYTVWRDSLNDTGIGLPADGDLDGVVGPGDLQVWRDNFGLSAAAAQAVPEPVSAVLAASVLPCLLVRRHSVIG